jgi:hypothetical protein
MATTTLRLRAGDVIEMDSNGDAVSALVLLATHEFVMLDACDGTMPIVVRMEDLGDVRVFEPYE